MESLGVVYAVTNRKYLEEAVSSLWSLKVHMPNISVTMFTPHEHGEFARKYFDNVVEVEPTLATSIYKVENMIKSPYDLTLYIDCDTHFCDNCQDIFVLLHRFDIAISHSILDYDYKLSNIPQSFQQFNSGVIAFRKQRVVYQFFDLWRKIYLELNEKNKPPKGDETSFKKALYESKISFYTLTPNYNFRVAYPNVLGENQKLKIIHGRSSFIDDIISNVNSSNGIRVYLPSMEPQHKPFHIICEH